MAFFCLALESGSEHINKKVFDRVYDRALYMKTVRACKALGIPFYSEVITYNPYEQEEDLRKTLDVLLEMRGGFSMCINKLFVLPGTKLAEVMERDGLKVGDASRDKLFNYYCRLFWVASYSRHARHAVRLIGKLDLFRRRPELLNPLVVKAFLDPVWAFRRANQRAVRPVKAAIRRLRPKPTGGARTPGGSALPNCPT